MFSRVETSTWLLGVFTLLSCVSAKLGGGLPRFTTGAARSGVSEAFSHSDSPTTLYSSDNYLKCTSDHHVTPTSTQEISDLIKLYTSSKEPVKIRATRRGFHSSAGFVCSGQRGSSKKEHHNLDDTDQITSVTMLLHLMNRVVSVDADHHQLTVEAGMTLLDLAMAAEANHMSVLAGALSIYANLTVGGVIMASAHGSGYKTTSSLGDLVRQIKWVNAKGEIILSDLQTEHGAKEVRALVGGLGLLGIATEFTLQLQPNSRTIVETRKGLKDTNMVADLKKMLTQETPHVITFWRPDFGTYKAVMWTQVKEEDHDSPTTPKFYPKGSIAYLDPVDDKVASSVEELMAAWVGDAAEESPSADVLNAGICSMSKLYHDVSIFQDGDGTLIDHGTIPTNNAMVSPDCTPKCFYEVHHTGTFTEDTEFTIKVSQLEDWVNDVKMIVKTELAKVEARLSKRYGEGKVTHCLSPGHVWLRFGQGNKNLLSTNAGSEDVVYAQWTHLDSAMTPNKLAKHSSIVETIEQLTLCKYKGRPHWGKNHERTFRHPECKARDNFPAANIAELLEMQQEHDPEKIFEPELFSEVLRKSGPEYSPLCTPHMWCYCADDSHCPHGHECRPSTSFPEYKICTLPESSSDGHDEL